MESSTIFCRKYIRICSILSKRKISNCHITLQLEWSIWMSVLYLVKYTIDLGETTTQTRYSLSVHNQVTSWIIILLGIFRLGERRSNHANWYIESNHRINSQGCIGAGYMGPFLPWGGISIIAGCCYNATQYHTMLQIPLQWPRQHKDKKFNIQNTSHTSP